MNRKNDLAAKVVIKEHEYNINSVLFRNIASEIMGLNASDMECLILLKHKGMSTPSELSRYAGISSGSTTAMIDRLEKKNFIKRIPNPEDRRSVKVVLTDEATRKISSLLSSVTKSQESHISSYSHEELDTLLRFFSNSISIWEEERSKLQIKN